jgi:hypothetical protein
MTVDLNCPKIIAKIDKEISKLAFYDEEEPNPHESLTDQQFIDVVLKFVHSIRKTVPEYGNVDDIDTSKWDVEARKIFLLNDDRIDELYPRIKVKLDPVGLGIVELYHMD